MFNAVQSAMMGATDKIDFVYQQDGLKWAAKKFFLPSGAPTLTLPDAAEFAIIRASYRNAEVCD